MRHYSGKVAACQELFSLAGGVEMQQPVMAAAEGSEVAEQEGEVFALGGAEPRVRDHVVAFR
jgi:hypothetical protein